VADVNKIVSVAVMLTVMFHLWLCQSRAECLITSSNSAARYLQPKSYATVYLLTAPWATSWCRTSRLTALGITVSRVKQEFAEKQGARDMHEAYYLLGRDAV